MDNKELFKAGLARMREKAAENGNHLSVAEILACFPDLRLTKTQIRLIHQYAEEEHMVIDDYVPHDTRSVPLGKKKMTGEEKAYFKMYLEDLKQIRPCDAEEVELLAERLLAGDELARNRLTEGHLHMVLELAGKRAGQGVLIGDLVQEGNMALVTVLSELQREGSSLLAGGLSQLLSSRVDAAIRQLIEEQSGHDKAGERMARETNRLLAATLALEEELGREATLAELSEKVRLPEDKVKELIKISLNAAEFSPQNE